MYTISPPWNQGMAAVIPYRYQLTPLHTRRLASRADQNQQTVTHRPVQLPLPFQKHLTTHLNNIQRLCFNKQAIKKTI